MTEFDKHLMQLAQMESARCRLHAWWYQQREKAVVQNPKVLLGEAPGGIFLEIQAMETVLISIHRQIRHVRTNLQREARGKIPALGRDDYHALFGRIQESIDNAERRKFNMDAV